MIGVALALVMSTAALAQDRDWWWNAPFKAFTMPSESMEPSIPPGSYMIAAKRSPSELRRGDLVILLKDGTPWVKRVVALPGDRVAMVEGRVRLNGQSAEYGPARSYTLTKGGVGEQQSERLPGTETAHLTLQTRLTPQDNTSEILVPRNRAYLLGDNRDNSSDSRFTLEEGGLELVAFDDIYGVIDPARIARRKPAP